MNGPLVSIIVPVYNTPEEKFRSCIRSILKQTYQNLEILLIDDGSREETRMLIDEAADTDARVSAIHRNNGGVSSARNAGIDVASGKYLMFVDADDCVNSHWLARALELAEENEADIVYGKIVMCAQAPCNMPEACGTPHQVVREDDLWKVQLALMHDDASPFGSLDLGPCAKLFSRRSIHDIRFPAGIKLSEDQVFNHAVLQRCRACVIMEDEAYYYVENLQSVSHTHHPDAVDVIARAMEMIRPYVYDRSENRQAYAFRVLDDMLYAIQAAYYCTGAHACTPWEIHSGLRAMRRTPVFAWAFSELEARRIRSRNWKIKFYLLKYSPLLFMVFRSAYRWKKHAAN